MRKLRYLRTSKPEGKQNRFLPTPIKKSDNDFIMLETSVYESYGCEI